MRLEIRPRLFDLPELALSTLLFNPNIMNRYPQLKTCIHSNTHFREDKSLLVNNKGLYYHSITI
jgi:hypothetical protein